MTPYPILRIKEGREVHLMNRHHAIFKNAILGAVKAEDGSIVRVEDHAGHFLCYATWNSAAYICGRAIAFEEGDPRDAMRRAMEDALHLRQGFADVMDTDAVRLINAEGDMLPGLIVDRYGETLVVQFTTLGMDRMREWIVETLSKLCSLSAIYEKSVGAARKKEGLELREGWIKGKGADIIDVHERGLTFRISLTEGQKTGLFLDQREMRSFLRSVAKGRTVLDCFCYVGGFAIAALAGGAKNADAVDYDGKALRQARENAALNCVSERFRTIEGDVFNVLRETPVERYDLIVLDPPAFAKRSSDVEQAKKAYKDVNRMAMELLPPGGLLLTCSCSYQMDAATFQAVIFHAAREARRNVRILQRHRAALDHPVNLYHPETEYLKSLLLWIA